MCSQCVRLRTFWEVSGFGKLSQLLICFWISRTRKRSYRYLDEERGGEISVVAMRPPTPTTVSGRVFSKGDIPCFIGVVLLLRKTSGGLQLRLMLLVELVDKLGLVFELENWSTVKWVEICNCIYIEMADERLWGSNFDLTKLFKGNKLY